MFSVVHMYRFLYIYLAITSDCLFCSYTDVDFFFFSLKNLFIFVTNSVFFLFIVFVLEFASY